MEAAAVERVAIVGGTGEEGFGLALRWARAGKDIVIGSRSAERARSAASRIVEQVPGGSVDGLLNEEAVAGAMVVVVTVPFAGQAVVYRSIADHLQEDTVVVDTTVPVAASVGGRVTRILGVWEGSAAQQAASLVPRSIRVCAAFHSLSATALHDLDSPLEGDVLVCGPKAAKPIVKDLVESLPELRFVDAGPIESARIVEPITALLVGINRRYGTDRAGIRITGIPNSPRDSLTRPGP